jgi:hypothetical protein
MLCSFAALARPEADRVDEPFVFLAAQFDFPVMKAGITGPSSE